MRARLASLSIVLTALVLAACASGGGSAPAKQTGVAPPPGSALAKVELGMSDEQVRQILGDPDDVESYNTGKAWIPYYYGPDSHRTDWTYKGVGRVVFSRNRYSGDLKVIRVDYDPAIG